MSQGKDMLMVRLHFIKTPLNRKKGARIAIKRSKCYTGHIKSSEPHNSSRSNSLPLGVECTSPQKNIYPVQDFLNYMHIIRKINVPKA